MVRPDPLNDALVRLHARAIASESTSFVAERGGEIVAEAGETERSVEIMSITKSVVSLEFREEVQRVLLGKVLPVSDRRLAPFYAMTWKANRPDGETRYGAPRSISANGWGGQYLLAIPSLDLVIVRLRAVEEDERGSFFDDVNALVLGVERPPVSPALRSMKVLIKVLGPLLRKRR